MKTENANNVLNIFDEIKQYIINTYLNCSMAKYIKIFILFSKSLKFFKINE